MRYWWVNHGRTYEDELHGGYLWAPKTNKDGARNQHFDNMLLPKPGDYVIAFSRKFVRAIGIVQESAREMANPFEGSVALNWNVVGWVLPVEFKMLENPIETTNFANQIAPLLPEKYSPLKTDGSGQQNYLSEISRELFDLIVMISSASIIQIDESLKPIQANVSELEKEIEFATKEFSGDLVKIELVLARRGQGFFKMQLRRYEEKCRLTGVSEIKHLRASHIKPWRKSTDFEKLDGNNGFLLAPHVDHLFDRGFISFEDSGELMISDSLNREVLNQWNIAEKFNAGVMRDEQRPYLAMHRSDVFKAS